MIRTKGLYIWVYLLLAVPLLFIRTGSSHDWGDDFAQYLIQSKYITGEINELPVSATSSHGPQIKGLLFSLLLTPVTAFSDTNEIRSGKLVISISLVLLGLMLLLFFRRDFGEFNSLLLSISIIYNFQFIRLKDQILPDFLLGAMVMLAILLFSNNSRKGFMLSLLIAGLSTGIKSAGLALVLSAAILIVFGKHQALQTKSDKWKALAVLAFPVFTMYLIEVLLTSQKPSVMWYSIITAKSAGLFMITENFQAYKNGLSGFFEFEIPMALNYVIKWMVMLLFPVGLLYSFYRKHGLAEWFVLIYFSFLLFYPYNKDPMRFLIPVVPLIVFTILTLVQQVANRMNLKHALTLPVIILAALTLQTLRFELKREIQHSTEIVSASQLFEFIKTDIEPGSLVADTKPWAISYFTGVRTVPFEAAYLADFRILRSHFNGSFPGPVMTGDSVVFKNHDFTVIRNLKK